MFVDRWILPLPSLIQDTGGVMVCQCVCSVLQMSAGVCAGHSLFPCEVSHEAVMIPVACSITNLIKSFDLARNVNRGQIA